MSKWWLSHLTDTDDNERARGKTFSMNKVQFEYQDKKYELIDIPGHRELVNEMILGASKADIVILVLFICDGEYDSGLMTLEHCMLSRAMGIETILIAINKMDSIKWDIDEYNRVKNDFYKKIKKYRFKTVRFIAISALYGLNIFTRYDNKLAECSLIEAINDIDISKHENKLIKPIDGVVQGLFIFHDIKNIISVGLKCLLHSNDSVFDVEFININNEQLNFVTQKNHKNKPIFISLRIDTHDALNSNVVLRNYDQTIAIGILG